MPVPGLGFKVTVLFQVEMRTGRDGPRAGLTFLGPRAERAETLPRKKQDLLEKTKISYKTNIKLLFV